MRYLVLLPLVVAPLHAQETTDGPPVPPIEDVIEQAEHAVDEGVAATDDTPIDLEVACGAIDDEETRARCWKAYQARLRYYESGLDHRTRVFTWQHFSSRVIFFAVLGLVVVGVWLAWLQFRRGMMKQTSTPSKAEVEDGTTRDRADHEIEISPQGLRVSSPVLGVVILALSLAFFYLYVVYVYRITEVF